jgi:hypothetical protein
MALAEVPYLFYLYNNPDEIHPYVIIHIKDLDGVFLEHLFYKFIFILISFIAIIKFNPRGLILINSFRINRISPVRINLIIIFFLLAMLLSYFLFLNAVGGFEYLFMNMHNKTKVVAGTSLYRNMFLTTGMLTLGFYIHHISISKRKSRIKILFLLILILFVVSILASYGERKNPIVVIAMVLILWNFKIKQINIFSYKNLFLFLIIVFFASLGPILRHKGAMDFYIGNPTDLFIDSAKNMIELFRRFSEVDQSLFIYSHFDDYKKLWWGSSFSDLITGFIPSAWYYDKPPLDEGVYIYALAHFQDVSPPTPFHTMTPVGWPLSRVTAGYVNFGIFGVIVYAFLTGYILKYFYNVFRFSDYSPQATIMYVTLMVTNFGINNSYILNNFMVLLILLSLSFIVNMLFNGKVNVSN